MRINILTRLEQAINYFPLHLNVTYIQKVIAYYAKENHESVGFLFHMNNAEYWFIHCEPSGFWLLHKYPPPVPSYSALPTGKNVTTEDWIINPDDLNTWVKNRGGNIDLYLDQ